MTFQLLVNFFHHFIVFIEVKVGQQRLVVSFEPTLVLEESVQASIVIS